MSERTRVISHPLIDEIVDLCPYCGSVDPFPCKRHKAMFDAFVAAWNAAPRPKTCRCRHFIACDDVSHRHCTKCGSCDETGHLMPSSPRNTCAEAVADSHQPHHCDQPKPLLFPDGSVPSNDRTLLPEGHDHHEYIDGCPVSHAHIYRLALVRTDGTARIKCDCGAVIETVEDGDNEPEDGRQDGA